MTAVKIWCQLLGSFCNVTMPTRQTRSTSGSKTVRRTTV